MKKLLIFLFLTVYSTTLFCQRVVQSKSDSLMQKKTIKFEKTASDYYVSAAFSSGASLVFAIGGFLLLNYANANEMAASSIQPIVAITQSGNTSQAYYDYLRTVAYQNGILAETKRKFNSTANTQKIFGGLSFVGSGIFAVKVVISLDKASKARIRLN